MINVRQDTPACLDKIHLNNAGASLPPLVVQHTLRDYYEVEAQTGGYETADLYRAHIAAFYPTMAALLNAQPHNIAWAASATDGYARALSTFNWKAGDIILTTLNDYVSNQLAFFSLRDRYGVQVIRANDLPEGGVDPDDMAQKIRQHRPQLVAVTHIPTNSGLVQPIETIGQVCRDTETWYLVDACQSLGQRPLDVQAIGCDFLTATARKYLRGPRGAGVMYASDRALARSDMYMLLPDMIGAHWEQAEQWSVNPTAKRFEYFEHAPALKLGTEAAARYFMEVGPEAAAARINTLGANLRQRLGQLEGVRVLDKGRDLCGIVTAWHPAFEGQKVMHWLRERGVNTSVSTRAAALLDFDQKGVDAALRMSVHYYNTEEELERTVALLAEYVGER
jgi:selenocysteine lyase/cysteine desulfurase